MTRPNIITNIVDSTWLHDESSEVAVPFELTSTESEVVCRYYSEAKSLVDEFLAQFGSSERRIFSDDAVKWLTEKFDAFLLDYGFELSPDSGDYYINFSLDDVPDELQTGAVRIYGDEDYEDLTDTDVAGLAYCGFIMYGVVVDGKIAAIANVGEPINDDTPKEVEIGVDTAEAYRRRGYGKCCIAALVKELNKMGHTAIYECASHNDASIGLISSLGGKAVSRKLYAVGFRE